MPYRSILLGFQFNAKAMAMAEVWRVEVRRGKREAAMSCCLGLAKFFVGYKSSKVLVVRAFKITSRAP